MALTLVNSGTATPTVGTVQVLDTETPGSPTLYIMEIDTAAMQAGDNVIFRIRKTATSSRPGLVYFGGATGSATATAASLALPNPPAGPLAYYPMIAAAFVNSTTFGPPTVGDSLSSSFTSLGSGTSGISGIAAYASPSAAAAPGDWGAQEMPYGTSGTVTGSAVSSSTTSVVAAGALGCTPAGYGAQVATTTSATPSVTTSASVASGDFVVGVLLGVGTVATPTPPAGWTTAVTFSGAGTAAFMSTTTSSSGTVTFNPTWSTSTSTRIYVVAFPTITGGAPVLETACGGPQLKTVKQSTPIPVAASESVEFDLLQWNGTGRGYPWKIWHL